MYSFLGFLLLQCHIIPSLSRSLTSNDLNIQLYEVDERNSILKILQSNGTEDVLLDTTIRRIRLECTAPFPVQWIYTGNGVPSLSSTIRQEGSEKFVASAYIPTLKESHSGRYECFSTQSPNLANKAFTIYIPGSNLFVASGNGGINEEIRNTIYIPRNDTKIGIPCAVSHPKILVTLEKEVGEVLIEVKSIGKISAYSFYPWIGFVLDTSQIQKPEGIYICSAVDNGIRKTLEFLVAVPRQNIPRDNERFTTSFRPPSKVDGNEISCATHEDCPTNLSCYTDLKCRNPCIHSIRCGMSAICRVVEGRRPKCECPSDYVGEPMKECFPSVQGIEPGFPEVLPTSTKSAASECKINEHCRSPFICLSGVCLDPCSVKICHRNAYCLTDGRVARCACNPGFTSPDGNGQRCIPDKFQGDPGANDEQSDLLRLVSQQNCNHNKDCSTDSICRKVRGLTGKCAPICGTRICGENAFCSTTKRMCLCEDGYMGNPYVACNVDKTIPEKSLPARNNGDCQNDSDCHETQKCDRAAANFGGKCIDACLGIQCPSAMECRREGGHKPICRCPTGYTGSASIGCAKDVEAVETFRTFVAQNLKNSRTFEVQTQTSLLYPNCGSASLNCGPNSECRVVNGNPSCICLPKFIGNPPNCKLECTFTVECPPGRTCLDNRCQDGCARKCGMNALCKLVFNGSSRTQNCSCLDGYQGNPDSARGCYPTHAN